MAIKEQPRTGEERCELARGFAKAFDLPLQSVELLVDDPDKGEPFEKEYAPWPLRLWLIRNDVVEWIAQPRDCSFDDAVVELLGMLNLEGLV